MTRTIHIIGAGLAGLAAAVKLAPAAAQAQIKVVVHEATAYPGGRCRSYLDRTVGMTIDNGNHLVLSGNHAVLGFVEAIGSASGLVGPETAEFPFVDLSSNERWRLHISDGLPWWIFDKRRRVPGTHLADYLRLWRLLRVTDDAPVGAVPPAGASVAAGGVEHRAARRLRGAGFGGGAGNACGGRQGVPATDRARGAGPDVHRAGN
jgi:phytoene dehydrogenase-like protein